MRRAAEYVESTSSGAASPYPDDRHADRGKRREVQQHDAQQKTVGGKQDLVVGCDGCEKKCRQEHKHKRSDHDMDGSRDGVLDPTKRLRRSDPVEDQEDQENDWENHTVGCVRRRRGWHDHELDETLREPMTVRHLQIGKRPGVSPADNLEEVPRRQQHAVGKTEIDARRLTGCKRRVRQREVADGDPNPLFGRRVVRKPKNDGRRLSRELGEIRQPDGDRTLGWRVLGRDDQEPQALEVVRNARVEYARAKTGEDQRDDSRGHCQVNLLCSTMSE